MMKLIHAGCKFALVFALALCSEDARAGASKRSRLESTLKLAAEKISSSKSSQNLAISNPNLSSDFNELFKNTKLLRSLERLDQIENTEATEQPRRSFSIASAIQNCESKNSSNNNPGQSISRVEYLRALHSNTSFCRKTQTEIEVDPHLNLCVALELAENLTQSLGKNPTDFFRKISLRDYERLRNFLIQFWAIAQKNQSSFGWTPVKKRLADLIQLADPYGLWRSDETFAIESIKVLSEFENPHVEDYDSRKASFLLRLFKDRETTTKLNRYLRKLTPSQFLKIAKKRLGSAYDSKNERALTDRFHFLMATSHLGIRLPDSRDPLKRISKAAERFTFDSTPTDGGYVDAVSKESSWLNPVTQQMEDQDLSAKMASTIQHFQENLLAAEKKVKLKRSRFQKFRRNLESIKNKVEDFYFEQDRLAQSAYNHWEPGDLALEYRSRKRAYLASQLTWDEKMNRLWTKTDAVHPVLFFRHPQTSRPMIYHQNGTSGDRAGTYIASARAGEATFRKPYRLNFENLLIKEKVKGQNLSPQERIADYLRFSENVDPTQQQVFNFISATKQEFDKFYSKKYIFENFLWQKDDQGRSNPRIRLFNPISYQAGVVVRKTLESKDTNLRAKAVARRWPENQNLSWVTPEHAEQIKRPAHPKEMCTEFALVEWVNYITAFEKYIHDKMNIPTDQRAPIFRIPFPEKLNFSGVHNGILEQLLIDGVKKGDILEVTLPLQD